MLYQLSQFAPQILSMYLQAVLKTVWKPADLGFILFSKQDISSVQQGKN